MGERLRQWDEPHHNGLLSNLRNIQLGMPHHLPSTVSHAMLRGEPRKLLPPPKSDLSETMEGIGIGPYKRWSVRNVPDTMRRALNGGDFDELNNVLRAIEVPLPDVYFQEDFQGQPLDFWASQIVCSNIQVGDANISYEHVGQTGFVFNVTIEGVRIECDLDYRYV